MAVLLMIYAVSSWMLALCLILRRPGFMLLAPGVAEVLWCGGPVEVVAATRPP